MAVLQIEYNSFALQRTVAFRAIIPVDTEEAEGVPYSYKRKEFPTVYLLNGLYGNMSDYTNHMDMVKYSEEYGVAFIIPSGENSWYVDYPIPYHNYGQYVGEELVKVSRSMFPLSSKREDTAIIGLSMGGFGALRLGFKHPDTFGFIGGFSSAVHIFEDMGLPILDNGFYAMFGDLKEAEFSEKNPMYIAEQLVEKKKNDNSVTIPDIYMSCGLSDDLLPFNRSFSEKLDKLGITHTYEEWEGEHLFPFWDESLGKALEIFKPKGV